MAEYYVIRDKNTGLYFRGKGANRWGKHYNQATIYRVRGTAEHSIKAISWRGEQAEIVPIRIIENTTDVVEVVRCKDCKHWHEETGWCYHHSHFIGAEGEACHPWESSQWKMLNADDFCSYGERKE